MIGMEGLLTSHLVLWFASRQNACTSMTYIYTPQRHLSPGPADNDLPPKQAEDNSVALRLYTSVNAQNVK